MDGKLFVFRGGEPPEKQRERRLGARQKRERDHVARRWVRPSDWLMHFLTLLLALMSAIYAGVLFERFGTNGAIRHVTALASCSIARSIGAGPSMRGELGYWAIRDIDRDGIACE